MSFDNNRTLENVSQHSCSSTFSHCHFQKKGFPVPYCKRWTPRNGHGHCVAGTILCRDRTRDLTMVWERKHLFFDLNVPLNDKIFQDNRRVGTRKRLPVQRRWTTNIFLPILSKVRTECLSGRCGPDGMPEMLHSLQVPRNASSIPWTDSATGRTARIDVQWKFEFFRRADFVEPSRPGTECHLYGLWFLLQTLLTFCLSLVYIT